MGRMKETIQDDLFVLPPPAHAFGGVTYDADADYERLGAQCRRVFDCMKDARWRTLEEIEQITGDPQSSISARLRDLRKEKFGNHVLERRARGLRQRGLYEYRLAVNERRSI